MNRFHHTLDEFGDLTTAEEKVLDAYRNGTSATVGEARPERTTPDNTVRADLIRYLLLGGCDECRPNSPDLFIDGAFVSGHLNLTRCRVPLGIILRHCRFERQIRAEDAHLRLLDLNGSFVPGIHAPGAKVDGDVRLAADFHATGQVRLAGAIIDGQLACDAGRFENPNGDALNAQDATVRGGVFLSEDFRAKGEVTLAGATIGGQLACDAGRFENPNGDALNAEGAMVRGGVFLSEDFRAKGEVTLAGATIGGPLSCIAGRFENPDGQALNAQDATVKGGVYLCEKFHATGQVRLTSAAIGGQLNCSTGRLENPEGHALNAENATVKGDVLLCQNFHATGEVSMAGANIGGQLDCTEGKFENPNGYALNAQSLTVDGPLMWREVNITKGKISFLDARVKVLSDDPESWPRSGQVFIDGFRYDTIIGADVRAGVRLKWLAQCHPIKHGPQPYQQLAKVLGDMGHRRDRGEVLMEMERLLSDDYREGVGVEPDGTWQLGRASLIADFRWIFSLVCDLFIRKAVGYGHRPAWALGWSMAVILFVAWFADVTWDAGDMVPNSPVVLVSSNWQTYAENPELNHPAAAWSAENGPGRDYETFNAFAYAADVFIPLIDFGQEDAWAPSTARGWRGRLLYYGRWFIKALGWLITALGAAAVTGIIRSDP